MKNKFVTAVTTAGLLAGILGSAFVPSVKAAAGVPVWKIGTAAATINVSPVGFATATEAGTSALPMILGDATVENLTITVAQLKDEFGSLVTGTASLSATGDVIFDAASAGAYNAGYTAGSVVVAGADIVLKVEEVSATASGTGSVTITLGGTSVTVYYDVLGPVASIVLTNGDEFTHLAAGASGTADKLTYVEKDAAGTTLTASAATAVSASQDGATAADVPALTAAGNYVLEGTGAGKLKIDAAACLAADAGKTRTIAIKIGTVTSNTISFVCTLGGGSAVLTGAALSETSIYAGGTAKVTYSFTDGTRKLGFGATVGTIAVVAADFPNSFAGTTSTKSGLGAAGAWDATGLVIDKDGKATTAAAVLTANAAVAVGNRQVKLTVADGDLATALAQAKAFTLKYSIIDELVDDSDATIVKVKYTVTADFGAAFAKKKISFVVENVATGSVVTYVRKANAAGKASYTIGRKGSFEVYAMVGDAVTDAVAVKR